MDLVIKMVEWDKRRKNLKDWNLKVLKRAGFSEE